VKQVVKQLSIDIALKGLFHEKIYLYINMSSDTSTPPTLQSKLFGNEDMPDNMQLDFLNQQKNEFNNQKVLIDNQTYSKLRKYQSLDYNIHKHTFNRTYIYYMFMLFSIIFVLTSLQMLDFISFFTCVGLISSMVMIFLVIAYLDLRINAYRRGHDWNKFYFNAIVRNKNDPYQNVCSIF
jgi:hypothetical protein